MTTLAIALAKIQLLEARIDALESGGARSSGGNGTSESGFLRAEPLPDHMLDNDWANAKIDKDPKGWKGPTQVNRTYSRAPAEWLTKAAHNLEYKAMREREAVPVALQERGKNAGKPWHEATMFKASILRGWALRNAGKAPPGGAPAAANGAPTAPAPTDDFDFGGSSTSNSDDEIPF